MCISGIATDSSEALFKKSQKDLSSEALMTFLTERKVMPVGNLREDVPFHVPLSSVLILGGPGGIYNGVLSDLEARCHPMFHCSDFVSEAVLGKIPGDSL